MSKIFSISTRISIQYYFRSEEPEYQLEDALKYSGHTGHDHKFYSVFLPGQDFSPVVPKTLCRAGTYQIYLIDA
jgi:hypothetical protein